jgi:hypothetical protein
MEESDRGVLGHDAKSRPTFDAIVRRLSSAEFVNDSINVDPFRAYQSRVLQWPTDKLHFIHFPAIMIA